MTRTQPIDGTSEHYLIRGGAAGRERLRVLARVMWPTTAGCWPGSGCRRTRAAWTWAAAGRRHDRAGPSRRPRPGRRHRRRRDQAPARPGRGGRRRRRQRGVPVRGRHPASPFPRAVRPRVRPVPAHPPSRPGRGGGSAGRAARARWGAGRGGHRLLGALLPPGLAGVQGLRRAVLRRRPGPRRRPRHRAPAAEPAGAGRAARAGDGRRPAGGLRRRGEAHRPDHPGGDRRGGGGRWPRHRRPAGPAARRPLQVCGHRGHGAQHPRVVQAWGRHPAAGGP
jgi:hypothetical protein